MDHEVNIDREIDRDLPRDVTREVDRRRHEPVRVGRQLFSMSLDERETLHDVARFRIIASRDLEEFKYNGNASFVRADLRSLLAQGLVERKTVWTDRDHDPETYWTLTKAGKKAMKSDPLLADGQHVYAGFVKPAEIRHDAAIYRMYHRERERIEAEGGRIRRVVLDYELKRKAYSPLAKARALGQAEYTKRQSEIAQEHKLKIVNGHIVLPDLRVEYETRQGLVTHVDLEMASKDYHGSHAAEKVAAGFTLYAEADTAARLSRALEEREITAEILSL